MERLGSVNSIHRYSDISRKEGGPTTPQSGMERINNASTVCRVTGMPRVDSSKSALDTPVKPTMESMSRSTHSNISAVKPIQLSDSMCSNKGVRPKGMAKVKPMQRIDNVHHLNRSDLSAVQKDKSGRNGHRMERPDRSFHRMGKSERSFHKKDSRRSGFNDSSTSVGIRYYNQSCDVRRTDSLSSISTISAANSQTSLIRGGVRGNERPPIVEEKNEDLSLSASLTYDESKKQVFNTTADDSVFKIPTMDASFRTTIGRANSSVSQAMYKPDESRRANNSMSQSLHKLDSSSRQKSRHKDRSSSSSRQGLHRAESVQSVPNGKGTSGGFNVFPDKSRKLSRADSQRSVRSTRSTGSCSSRIMRKKSQESIHRLSKDPKMGKAGLFKGFLRASVYENSGMLTVHVKEGKRLQSTISTRCNSFIRVSLIPDEANRSHCRSEVAMETNNPDYDEKFSFELMEADARKRVYISAWNIEAGASDAELLGCMSFGLKHIIQNNKAYDGWFYLLNEERGKQKHFAVGTPAPAVQLKVKRGGSQRGSQRGSQSGSQSGSQRGSQSGSQSDLTASDNEDDQANGQDENIWTDTHHVTIKRGPDGGFGFTIHGSKPAKICKVEPGSTAEKAGLRENDHITRVNTLVVNQAGSQDVANLIRYYKHSKIQLEVERPYKVSDLHSVSQYSVCSSVSNMSYKSSITSQSMMSSQSSVTSKSDISRQTSFSSLRSLKSMASVQSLVDGVTKKKRKLKRFANEFLNKFR